MFATEKKEKAAVVEDVQPVKIKAEAVINLNESGEAVFSKFLFCLKISIASILAIVAANLLKLDFSVSAGIVAILSVQFTKKETIKTALSRFFAFIVALIISFACFKIFGFTTTAFFVYLFIFIAACIFFGWNSAMAMDSVLISHFINLGAMGFSQIKNEVLLFVIGVGFGIISNLFLRKKINVIEELKSKTDDLIKLCLHRMSLRILDAGLADYDGSCFAALDASVFEAKKQAEQNFNNQFGKKDTYDIRYVQMREKQVFVLREMFKCLKNISSVPHTAQVISDFFEKVSVEFHRDNDVELLLNQLEEIISYMKTRPLPVERKEFEDRANLFILLQKLKEFLQIKNSFVKL